MPRKIYGHRLVTLIVLALVIVNISGCINENNLELEVLSVEEFQNMEKGDFVVRETISGKKQSLMVLFHIEEPEGEVCLRSLHDVSVPLCFVPDAESIRNQRITGTVRYRDDPHKWRDTARYFLQGGQFLTNQ